VTQGETKELYVLKYRFKCGVPRPLQDCGMPSCEDCSDYNLREVCMIQMEENRFDYNIQREIGKSYFLTECEAINSMGKYKYGTRNRFYIELGEREVQLIFDYIKFSGNSDDKYRRMLSDYALLDARGFACGVYDRRKSVIILPIFETLNEQNIKTGLTEKIFLIIYWGKVYYIYMEYKTKHDDVQLIENRCNGTVAFNKNVVTKVSYDCHENMLYSFSYALNHMRDESIEQWIKEDHIMFPKVCDLQTWGEYRKAKLLCDENITAERGGCDVERLVQKMENGEIKKRPKVEVPLFS